MGKTLLILLVKPKENILAILLTNMLTLQTDHHIPMRMDISTSGLYDYYRSYENTIDDREGARILQCVISDLKEKLTIAI